MIRALVLGSTAAVLLLCATAANAATLFRLALQPSTVTFGMTVEFDETVTVSGDLHIDVLDDFGMTMSGSLGFDPISNLGLEHLSLLDMEATLAPAPTLIGWDYHLSDAVLTFDQGHLSACCVPPAVQGAQRDFSLDPLSVAIPNTIIANVLDLFAPDPAIAIPLDLQVSIPEVFPDLILRGDLSFQSVPVPEPSTGLLLGLGIAACAVRRGGGNGAAPAGKPSDRPAPMPGALQRDPRVTHSPI